MPIVTRESLREMIETAPAEKVVHIIGRALVRLFERQTQDERKASTTAEDNGVGFSGADGRSGSITAKSYLKRRTLEQWQVEAWTKPTRNGYPRICKYAKQLNEIAEELAKAKQDKAG